MIYIDKEITLTDLNKDCYILFTTTNCNSCMKLINTMDKIDCDLDIYVINEKYSSDIARDFNIFSAPTVIKLIDYKEDDRFFGARDLEYLKKFF